MATRTMAEWVALYPQLGDALKALDAIVALQTTDLAGAIAALDIVLNEVHSRMNGLLDLAVDLDEEVEDVDFYADLDDDERWDDDEDDLDQHTGEGNES